MAVTYRTYNNDTMFGSDYYKLRDFLLRLGDINYPFGRWDWMITGTYRDRDGLEKIGIWEDDGEIVALATFDTRIDGSCFFPHDKNYPHLLCEMITHAEENLSSGDGVRLMIRDGDEDFQNAAAGMGYFPTQNKDCDAVFIIDETSLDYELPDGFKITSMAETYDLFRYGQALWRGFNHEANGEGPFDFNGGDTEGYELQFRRPNVNLDLKVAVVAPNGDFVSYCGMWYEPASEYALVEPVATDPAYRRMGLGRAAVLEAIKRCGKLGAKRATVGSSQQFYYSIGFRPYMTSMFWEKKNARGN